MPKLGTGLNLVDVALESSKAVAIVKIAETVGAKVVEKVVSKSIVEVTSAVVPNILKSIADTSLKSGVLGSIAGSLAVPAIKASAPLIKQTGAKVFGYTKGFEEGQKLAVAAAALANEKLVTQVQSLIQNCSLDELFQLVVLLVSKNKSFSNLITILKPIKVIFSYGSIIAAFGAAVYYGNALFIYNRKLSSITIGTNQLLDDCLKARALDFRTYQKFQMEIGNSNSIRRVQEIADELYILLYVNKN